MLNTKESEYRQLINHASRLSSLIDLAQQRFNNPQSSYLRPQSALTAGSSANLFFTTSVLGMKAMSRVIEDQALRLDRPFRFYSAFQKFSRFAPQEKRYRQMLATGNPVYIFGQPDAPVLEAPNLVKVKLEAATPGGPSLANYWWVILQNPEFVSMALLARELPRQLPKSLQGTNQLVYRNFEGFWTYDREVISRIVDILDSYIGEHTGQPQVEIPDILTEL